MVPSDLKPSLASSLRAWPQALRSKGDWRLPRYCSPLLVFASSGSSLPRASARLSLPEPASRSGFPLPHDDRPFPSGHYEVTVSDRASSTPRSTFLRSVWPAARLRSGCSGVGISTPLARCPDFCPPIPVSPRLSAALSGLAPCGSQRSHQFATEKLALPKQPDFRCSSTGRYAAGGSSLRIRYCFGGSTFLKPLGTDSILPPVD